MKLSLTDKAYEEIKADILSCLLEPGMHVAQSQLADTYGMGLMPVRKALQRLAHEGFVESIPGFGYVVTPITLSDVYEIYELRSIVEPAAARLAAERASQEQLERLSEIAENTDFTYVYGDRQSYSEYLAKNTEFHMSVVNASNNQRLINILSKILDELSRVFHLYLGLRDYTTQLREEHAEIASAIHDRDAERAAQIVGEQTSRSLQRVLEALNHAKGGGPSRALSRAVQLKGPRT
jgi:DNA-binding GntR family transcriptional regulator